jgi:predicted dehydrogenase
MLGPEYSLAMNSLDTELKIFLSRDIGGGKGEDLVEKQNAETGLMPIVSHEASAYGYEFENRHMVERFLDGKRPDETFEDGVHVMELLMAAYMSAEQEKTIEYPPPGLDEFIPLVAQGKWNPRKQ